MAGQNVISLGIDVSAFDAQKKAVLNEFIALFEKLEKYDGKKYSPVSGAGLTAFNSSIQQTSTLLDQIQAQLSTLNSTVVTPKIITTQAVQSVNQVTTAANNATTAIKQSTAATNQASGSLTNMGKGLTQALSSLRNIAYILPGIGIAGIFNLAFQAIEKTVEELGLLDGAEAKNIEFTSKLNDAWLEVEDTFLKVYDANRKLFSFSAGSYDDQLKITQLMKAQGESADKILKSEVDNAKVRVDVAGKGLSDQYFGGIKGVEGLRRENALLNNQIQDLTTQINDLKPGGAERENIGHKEADARIELLDSQLKQIGFDYKNNEKIIEEYYTSINDLADKKAKLDKFNADQERKYIYETSKEKISVHISQNEQILHNDISAEKQRLDAIEQIRREHLGLNSADLQNVLGNNSSTPRDRDIARNRFNDENLKANIKAQEDAEKVIEEYRQRRLKAQESIDKDEVDKVAIKNERIYKDENQSLEDRLKSYTTYIQKKQVLQDLEYNLAIEKHGLTSLEISALGSGRDTQKANTQADVEKQVYDIVYSSLQKQLKAVLDENEIESDVNKEAHIKALHDLNEKNLSYEKYKEKRHKIDLKYKRLDLQEAITDDNEAILRLEVQLDKEKRILEQANKDVERTKDELGFAKLTGGDVSGAQLGYDSATGAQTGASQGVSDAQKKITEANKKLTSDKLKLEELNGDDSNKKRTQWAKAAEQIEKALFSAIKELSDSEYQYKLDQLERQKSLIDEQYGYEIAAIEKSSLSAKDKAALDIQLNAQKMTYDKNAQAEERRLKIEQAEFDKKLSIANIIIGTAAAVIAGIPPSPKSIAAGIVGAIELATAIATPIPSFKEGVKGFKGGLARFGEDGYELVKEPYRSPYLAISETISILPKGTDIIPMKDSPVFGERIANDNWEQTRWLAKKLMPQKTKVNNIINIDLGFEMYKHKVLYGGRG